MMKNESKTPDQPWTTKDLIAVCFTIVFPTFVTLVYFQWLESSESSIQQTAFGIGKFIQFSFPIIWIWLFHRSKLALLRETVHDDSFASQSATVRHAVVIGVVFGLLVVTAMFGIYFLWLAPSEIGPKLIVLVKEKVADLGVNSFWVFAAMGVIYSLFHSLLEEYYWRWFVFDGLQRFVSFPLAMVISGLGFMSHHVILLGFYFDWQWMTYPASFCIAVGGMFWAWQFHITGKLRPSWISHMIVDAGIFALGYLMIRDML